MKYNCFQDYMNEINSKFIVSFKMDNTKSFLYCKYKNITEFVKISPSDIEDIKAENWYTDEIINLYIEALHNKIISNKQYIRLQKFKKLTL